MTPYQQQTNQTDSSTSMWTESGQPEMMHATDQSTQSAMAERPCDSETQAPTHDALSSIYNRGY